MARIKGPRKIPHDSVEFKLKAAKLSDLADVPVQDVADTLEQAPVRRPRGRRDGECSVR